ncbi:MAG: hypothetical protein HUK06_01685 [Bacteroidaceae bacterium]|nr:hypothetical protein [Bacteroidaceae bacterium]
MKKLLQAHKCRSEAGFVYDTRGISPTIIAGTHGYAIGYIMVYEAAENTDP